MSKEKLYIDMLNKLLNLEVKSNNIYIGENHYYGSKRVFGGRVLCQALAAASKTVTNRLVHSLHAYFLRPGNAKLPIEYEVEISRDGRSFSSRRVIAKQKNKTLLNMSVSFHIKEDGKEHQSLMPDVENYSNLDNLEELSQKDIFSNIPDNYFSLMTNNFPFEIKPVNPTDIVSKVPVKPIRNVWVKYKGKLSNIENIHYPLLSYLSDFFLLGTANLPYSVLSNNLKLQMASLDHSIWFHRPCRVDEWLLYSMESPNACGSRGFSIGKFFNSKGILIASVAQEGLIRFI
tara:strand:- start:3 stop:869 length:867 start_codon:yes stop_codon:yes gene_type:complete